MFKKIMFSLFLVLVSFSLVACGDKEEPRTYVHDGVYTAFEQSLNGDAPQLVTVSVTIKDDKIASVFIDTIQGSLVNDKYEFNAKSKKALKYEYYMFPASGKKVNGVLDVAAYKTWLKENNKLEWFEQANLLEQKIVAGGVDSIAVTDGKTNITGITVTVDSYVKLAKEAIKNAKEGKLLAVEVLGSDIVWATASVDKEGKVTSYKIDTLQGKTTTVGEKLVYVFNEKSKQQLGYEYYMFPASGKKVDGVLDVNAYKTWLKANNKLEWFEQVALIAQKFEANPFASYFFIGGEFNKDLVTGVTISDNKYIALLQRVLGSSQA